MIQLAREIAMDIFPLDQILKNRAVTNDTWDKIRDNPRFNALLRTAMDEWNSSLNTGERVKIKAMAFVEEAMPEFFGRVHDPLENLPAKVETLKAIGRFAGLGIPNATPGAGGSGERFSVTINMGDDKQLKIERTVPPQVIEQNE